MPSFRVNVAVDLKGAVFNSSDTKAEAARTIIAINDAIAVEGVNQVVGKLRRVLRNPTGYYTSRVTVERRQIYRGVWDQKVPYGGWLEGVTARNRTSSFKGYHVFADVRQALKGDARKIAEPLVADFIKRMNG
jgi:outer membrane translocation and assembly module TamA